MDNWWLAGATVLALVGVLWSWRGMRARQMGAHSFWWLAAAFGCQLMFLIERGEARGKCPLQDAGELLVFLAWSMTLFYLITGSTYRVSLLGFFTAPLVLVMQGVALIPGVLDAEVERYEVLDPWSEAHAALSVMSYGALGLAAVAAVMYLILDRRLKSRLVGDDLTKSMPSVHKLVVVMGRVGLLGWVVLTAGVVTGFLAEGGGWNKHLVVAIGVWVAYGVLFAMYLWRGVPPRTLGLGLLGLFLVSLMVFGKI